MIPTASSSASPAEGRGEQVVGHLARVRRDLEQLERERRNDHADEHGDHRLQLPEAGGLQQEDRERGDDGDHRAPAERDPEQEAEPERRAQHLGQVGRHRDHLRLQPQAERDAAGELLAADLGEVVARRDPQLRRERLDEHRHQVRAQHRPEQQVPELRAAGDVGGEVARVEIRNGRDERRADERPQRAQTVALAVQGLLRRLHRRRLARENAPEQVARRVERAAGVHEATSTRITRASFGRRRWVTDPARTPPGTISTSISGADPQGGELAQQLRVAVGDAHEPAAVTGAQRGQRDGGRLDDGAVHRGDRVAVRIVRRLAELGGDPLLESLGEDVLEYLGLRVHAVPGHAELLDEVGLEQPVMAEHLERDLPPLVGELHAAVWDMADVAERRELLHHRGHRRRTDAEPLRERRGRGDPVALLERVNRLCVVLDRRGELHPAPKFNHA